MIELKTFVDSLNVESTFDGGLESYRNLVVYLQSWGYMEEGKMEYAREENAYFIESTDGQLIERTKIFLLLYNKKVSEKVEILFLLLTDKWPHTSDAFRAFTKKNKTSYKCTYKLILNFLFYLTKDFCELEQQDLYDFYALVESRNLAIVTETLQNFILYLLDEGMLSATISFRRKMAKNKKLTEAYSKDAFVTIYGAVFSQKNWEKCDITGQCKENPKLVNYLLYISTALDNLIRGTDIERFPRLVMEQAELDELVNKIYRDDWDEVTGVIVAKTYINTVIGELRTISKTGEPLIHVSISPSFLSRYGLLLVLRERYCRDHNVDTMIEATEDKVTPRLLGPEFYAAINGRFSVLRANKARAQLDARTADQLIEAGEKSVSGYVVAAMERGHKSPDTVSVSGTTSIYLKDAKFDGVDVNIITEEMMKRGVMSMQVYTLLEILDKSFQSKSIEEQTNQIVSLGMSALDAEVSVGIKQMEMTASRMILHDICMMYPTNPVEGIKQVVDALMSGKAPSKMPNVHCLRHALGSGCCCPETRNCVGCPYEVLTLSMVYELNMQMRALVNAIQQSDNLIYKKRTKALLRDILCPVLREVLQLQERNQLKDRFKTAFTMTRESLAQVRPLLEKKEGDKVEKNAINDSSE